MGSLDLGIVGNCTISALIDRAGTMVWSCFPRFDGDPLFCSLLDDGRERGFYGIELDRLAEAEQRAVQLVAPALGDRSADRGRADRLAQPVLQLQQEFLGPLLTDAGDGGQRLLVTRGDGDAQRVGRVHRDHRLGQPRTDAARNLSEWAAAMAGPPMVVEATPLA